MSKSHKNCFGPFLLPPPSPPSLLNIPHSFPFPPSIHFVRPLCVCADFSPLPSPPSFPFLSPFPHATFKGCKTSFSFQFCGHFVNICIPPPFPPVCSLFWTSQAPVTPPLFSWSPPIPKLSKFLPISLSHSPTPFLCDSCSPPSLLSPFSSVYVELITGLSKSFLSNFKQVLY